MAIWFWHVSFFIPVCLFAAQTFRSNLSNCEADQLISLVVLIIILSHRVTGAAVQVSCEMRSGRRHSRAVTSDLSFSRLELLECLWEDGQPQYSEVEHLLPR